MIVGKAGHSSTSLSAALGYAIARDIKKENYEVVALIGDGALKWWYGHGSFK